MVPTAFISYAHDTEPHKVRVRTLADRLGHEGVDAMIDQYEPHPSEGWPKWMEKQMARNYLLIVLSPRFVEGFEQAETSMGGARYKSVILSARLLRQGVNYSHTALAVFSSYDDRICSTPV